MVSLGTLTRCWVTYNISCILCVAHSVDLCCYLDLQTHKIFEAIGRAFKAVVSMALYIHVSSVSHPREGGELTKKKNFQESHTRATSDNPAIAISSILS